MSLSPELQARFATEVDVDWYEAIILSHSLAGQYYLTTRTTPMQGKVDGAVQMFLPIPFAVQLPKRDGQGQQDLTLSICNIGKEMYTAVELAAGNYLEPIRCRYTIYIAGNLNPQLDPMLDLSLTNIAINATAMTATATRAQVFSMGFPKFRYRPDLFPGIARR